MSVRYGGQEWTCARCHQLKKDCPGLAVARNCAAERVLLSVHMGEHWDKIDYKPENTALNEVDEDTDPDIQVGIKEKETVVVVPDSTLTSKYSSVIIRWFRSETSVDSILEVLSLQGVAGITEEDVTMNAKSGSVTVENLKPEDCLILVGKMNKKRFLSRNIFVTSVVSASPSKNPATNPEPNPASNVSIVNQQSVSPTPAPDLGNFLTPHHNATENKIKILKTSLYLVQLVLVLRSMYLKLRRKELIQSFQT